MDVKDNPEDSGFSNNHSSKGKQLIEDDNGRDRSVPDYVEDE